MDNVADIIVPDPRAISSSGLDNQIIEEFSRRSTTAIPRERDFEGNFFFFASKRRKKKNNLIYRLFSSARKAFEKILRFGIKIFKEDFICSFEIRIGKVFDRISYPSLEFLFSEQFFGWLNRTRGRRC